MKTILLSLLILGFVSCDRNEKVDEFALPASEAYIVTAMSEQLSKLKQTASQLPSATTTAQRHHVDSTYHYHDSVYWHHHNQYSGNHHPHNDHQHQWVHYDPTINHAHHYHHSFPGHPHDSLVVVSTGHHSNHTIYHPGIHSLHDHHVMDSLHNIHQVYHH